MSDMNLSLEDMMNAVDADMCMQSFSHFVKEMWETIEDCDFVMGWHIQVMCDEAQIMIDNLLEGNPKIHDSLTNVPPGTSKSTVYSVMLPAYVLARDPTQKIGCISYSKELSYGLSQKCRRVIESDKYMKLFPHVKLRDDQNLKSHFATVQGGERYATSVGATITGKHFSVLVLDDPLSASMATSLVELNKANEWVSTTLSTRKTDKEKTIVFTVMQRLAVDDTTGYLINKNKGNLFHICLPAELDENVTPVKLRDKYIDGLLDPKRMNRKVLKEMELDLGTWAYIGQFQQRPFAKGGTMFETENIEVVQAIKKDDVVDIFRSWDLAGTLPTRKQPDPDFTVGLKMAKMKDNSFIILDVIRGRWSADKRNKIIHQAATMDGKRAKILIEQEGGSGGKEQADGLIRSLAGFHAIKEKPVGNKETRAGVLSAQINISNVKMVKAKWNKELLDEFQSFPLGKHDDIVDACSSAFAKLNKTAKARIRQL